MPQPLIARVPAGHPAYSVPTMSLPAPGPAERIRIPREIWVLVAAAFVIALGFGLITPVLPQFAQSFGVGATASSVVVSAFAFFRLVFAPVCGRLIAVLGERPVYLIGLLVVAVSTGATAFAGSYWQLLVFRGLGGIGSTMFTVSAVALLVRLAPATIRGRVASAYGSAFLLGGIGGPVVGGALGGLGPAGAVPRVCRCARARGRGSRRLHQWRGTAACAGRAHPADR